MPAKLCEKLRAFLKTFKHIIFRNRTCRTLHAILNRSKHNSGTTIPFSDSSRYDSNKTFVAIRQFYYQHFILNPACIKHIICLFHKIRSKFLSLFVKRLTYFCILKGLGKTGTFQKTYSL